MGIVGDISSWKAQQNENEQKYQQQQQQNDYNAYPKLSDGAPQTGGAYNPRLHQSRTSATGQQHPQFNAISGIQNNYNRKQSYEHNPILQSAANDNQNEIIPSSISAYNPNVPAPNVPEESSSSDDDLNDLVNGNAFKQNEPKQSEEDINADDKIQNEANDQKQKEEEEKKEDDNEKKVEDAVKAVVVE